ncbi:type III secretion system needle filament subunit SctF [Rouxiella sp. T17]|uniref:type III secretion system needle filament subunit SctF n=1 Tax=Rouxiella sp. T17 TaxID=3085684 RepID=UPI002FC67630
MNKVNNYNAPGTLEYIMNLSDKFNTGVTSLKGKLDTALLDLNGGPGGSSDTSDPTKLANYQAALSAYTLFCNAQSSSVKAFKDIAAATISNFR